MNANLLRGEIVSKGMTMQEVAKYVGLSRNSFSARVQGRVPFNSNEIVRICELLQIEDASKKVSIFLS